MMKSLKRRQFLKTVAGTAGIGIAGLSLSAKNTLSAKYYSSLFTIKDPGQYSIYVGPNADQVTQFAAEELKKYVRKISSIELQINNPPVLDKKCAVIITSSQGGIRNWEQIFEGVERLKPDGLIIRSGKDYVAMAGSNPRGALYAVYGFLETLGCRFYGLGESGEIIPKMDSLSVPELAIEENPTFRWRDWSEDSSYAHRSKDPDHTKRHKEFWLLLADWCGKNRINMTGNSDYPEMLDAFAKRGITRWTGGHIIPHLLPRELFSQYPDYFRMDQTGKRVNNGNFCPSNPAALKIVSENGVKHIKENSYAKNLEIWGEDVREGSWCFCPECKKISVQDQYLTTCNAIARAVKEAGIDIDIDAIAYHDSIEPDVSIKPEPNLKLMWAPRERSYGHALNDMRSERNQWYAACFEKWASIFGPKNMDLFEYYTDNILFRTFPVSTQHVIAQDIQYYTDIGLDNHCLVCHLGDYAFQSEPLSCYVYSRMLYNRNQDVDEIIAEYCKNVYGPASTTMQEWHNKFEEAMHYCATYGDIQSVPTESSPRVEKLMSEISKSLDLLKKTNMLVKRALSETDCPLQRERINTRSWVNEFAIIMVNGLFHQIRGEYYFARINEMIWRAKASNRDPYARLSGRYIQVRDEMQLAVKYYEDTVAFIKALPPKDHSVWTDTSLPNHNKGVCDVLKAKIAECQKHIE